jgi:hypothetical protein
MADLRPHFEIPPERVRFAAIHVRGRAKPYSRPNYSAHADYLRERTASLKTYAAETADAEQTESLFFQVRTPVELPARGERQRLHNAGLQMVALSRVHPNTAIVQLRKEDIATLEEKVERYGSTPKHRGKSYLSVIDDIAPVPPEEKLGPDLLSLDDNPLDCLLIFYASLTERERAAILFAVRSFLLRSGHTMGEQRRLSNGVTIVEARLRPSEAREVGAAFSTLRQIVPNRVFFVPDGWRISSISPEVAVEHPRGATSVAVVDTGISSSCAGVATTVIATLRQLPAAASTPEFRHGTFVGCRVLYGDELESALRSGVLKPICPLVDVPVIGLDSAGNDVGSHEAHLAAAIDAVLPTLPRSTRVVNVSLGTDTPSIDGEASIVAQVLDKHARERDLLVVTTAGNMRDLRLLSRFPGSLSSPSYRIDSPGDALLALTVGSIAKYQDRGCLSRVREMSAFSRRGPGPFGGIKPDLVAHGGNCLADGSTSARVGVHGLAVTGHAWECDYGTSFAAPLVSAMGAQLFDHYREPTANLVRALLLHFTDPVLVPEVGIQQEHLTGVGEPNLDSARWSGDHSAAFLHTGHLSANTHAFLPFYVPACLAEGSDGKLSIRVTVVIDPPVTPDNQVEYAKARVSIALRKPADVGHQTISLAENLIDADQWCPVAQMVRAFHRSYPTGEWELQLRLWTRDLPPEFQQSFAAIIEVVDETGTQPVRTDVESEAGGQYPVMEIRAAA